MTRAQRILFEVGLNKKVEPRLTLRDLMESAEKTRKKMNKSGTVKVLNMKPLVGNDSLTINAEAYGTRKYPMTMTFFNIDYSEEQTRDYPLAVTPQKGTRFYMPQLDEDTLPVQVRCQCPDFRFTWAEWDKKEHSLSGRNFPRYRRKTENRPERNPDHAPGLCKHLYGLVERLKRDRIMKR